VIYKMGSHALLSASSAHRWIYCSPSARLEEQFENTTSIFAEEGTAAHALSEHKLREYLGIKSVRPSSSFFCKDMEQYTDDYVNFAVDLIAQARDRCKDPIVLIEQKLDYSHYCSEGYGTGDLVIIADGILDICDLKYGLGVPVYAENNPQMRLYALGALALFDDLYDIQTVRMSICQPRLENISSDEMTVIDLKDWAENTLRPAAELAFKGEGEFAPSDYTCKFCRAKAVCRARSEKSFELAKCEFALPPTLTDDEIQKILPQLNELISWANDVYAYAQEKAIEEGKEWTGFKVVEGRSNRKYTDKQAVLGACLAYGKTDEELHTHELIGITDMEKLLGKKKFNEILCDLVEKPQNKLALVADSDKRTAVNINAAGSEFKEEI
jgi:hypothetical protein